MNLTVKTGYVPGRGRRIRRKKGEIGRNQEKEENQMTVIFKKSRMI